MPLAFARVFLVVAVLVLAPLAAPLAAPPSPDAEFHRGWDLLSDGRYEEARKAFGTIAPNEFDLGDYVLYLTGLCQAQEGDRRGASATMDNLAKTFPESPLIPYMAHALAYAAAVDNDLPAARAAFDLSRGKVGGNGFLAEESYIGARLLEEEGPNAKAAEAHLGNFVAHTAQEAAHLSKDRLAQWRREGKWEEWKLPVSFYGAYAKSLSRTAENGEAAAIYAEALRRFPPSDDYYTVLLDYAEYLRKRGDTGKSKAILDKAVDGAPPAFRLEVEFLRARVSWKAGRLDEARKAFLAIADGGARTGTAQRARYYAAWIAEEEDLAAAAEEFGKLRDAQEEAIRQESAFRAAFELYRLGRFDESIPLFEAGEKSGFSSVEKARHSYWKARALMASGRKDEAAGVLVRIAADPGAGPYALFANWLAGRDPYAILNAASSGETASCAKEKDRLWEKIRKADWGKEDAEKFRRAERLIGFGIQEYAILEAERVDRATVRKTLGLADGATAGLVRYLAGDLRGAIRETNAVTNDPAQVELVDMIQFPLAPQYVGDCERKRSGVDPLMLHAVIRQESHFQKNALSPAGAVGLMQLMPRTAAEVARREKMRKPRRRDLLNPAVNVTLGAAYLSRLVREYGGDYLRAVAAYNAGNPAVSTWWDTAKGDPSFFLEIMSYRETRFYIRRVFFNVLQYYQIYRPKMFAQYFPNGPKEEPRPPDVLSIPPTVGTPGPPPAPAADPGGGLPGG